MIFDILLSNLSCCFRNLSFCFMRIKSFTIVKFISNYCHKITSKLFFGKEVEIVLNILNENIKD